MLYGYGIFKQIGDLSELKDRSVLTSEISFALVFLLLVTIRYIYMQRGKTFPGAFTSVHPLHRKAAKAVHLSIYFTLILLPLSGLAIAALVQQGRTSGLLPDLAVGLHEFAASLSYLLILIHVTAAIYSRIKGEGIWSSMVPIWKENQPSSHRLASRLKQTEKRLSQHFRRIFLDRNH